MSKSYKDIIADTSACIARLRCGAPEVMQGFYALSGVAGKAGALDGKTKELIAMALSVAARCDPCIGYHAQSLVQYGATRAEVEETLDMCISMGGGSALMYAAAALAAYEEFGGEQVAA
ncbi:MAG: carboxymuconolactone decarboxylase family protein [Burkholderiaceae bacterium]|jgi:AhpD family alkylhydroperoxidase|nr:carboxymuconolactone decarboxylase family protein [Burkholderiaceae bacterium]